MEWFKRVLQDEKENPSSKRVIAMVGSSVLFLSLLLSALLPVDISPSPALIDGCVWVIAVCLGASTVDKFTKQA